MMIQIADCTIAEHFEPEAFEACFVSWIQEVAQLSQGEIVPIDGKCLRRSYDRGSGQAAIYSDPK